MTPSPIGAPAWFMSLGGLLLAVAPAAAHPLQAEEWSRFRGPNGSGLSDAKQLPLHFSPEHNSIWATELPPGHSSPVLAEELIFLTAFEEAALYTYCLDTESGDVLWRAKAPRDRNTQLDARNNSASATPAAHAGVVVVFFPDFGMLGYDFDGEELWRKPLGPFDNIYGMGASPIIAGDTVLLACDQQKDSYLLAIDLESGAHKWRTPRRYATSGHCTPILWTAENGEEQVLLPGSFYLDAYSLATGERRWWVPGLCFEMKSVPVIEGDTLFINGYGSPMNDPGNQISMPAFEPTLEEHDADHNGAISADEMPRSRARGWFTMVDLDHSGELNAEEWQYLRDALSSQNGMLAIRLGGKGDRGTEAIRWAYRRSIPQLPSPLICEGALYLLHDRGGLLATLDVEDGELIERGRLSKAMDNYYASPVAGDGKIYLVSQGGIVTVLPMDGGLEPLATVELGEDVYATPALADGRIYLRTEKRLYCFGEIEKKVAKGPMWPEYRGPRADGHAPACNPPEKWSEEHNLRWKTPIHGRGWSTPVVWDNKAWLTTSDDGGHSLVALCIDVDSGKVLFDRTIFEVQKPQHRNNLNSHASPSAVVEEGRVYLHFGSPGTACLDARTYEVLWTRRDLDCDHLEGAGSSPLLFGDLLIFNVDGADVQYVVALDKRNGRTRWLRERSVQLHKLPADRRKAFNTPIILELDGHKVLLSSGAEATYGYDPANGDELWRLRHPGFSMSARSVVGEGLVFINTGFMRPQIWALKLEALGAVRDKRDLGLDRVAWRMRRNVGSMSSPVVVDGMLFTVNDTGMACCLDAATGEFIWRERLDGPFSASPVLAGDRLYYCDREGRTTVLAPEPKFQVLAINDLEEGCMASPIVLGDALVLRTTHHLYRLERGL